MLQHTLAFQVSDYTNSESKDGISVNARTGTFIRWLFQLSPRIDTNTFEKGFNPTLFECFDKALVSVLGRESVSTFYYFVHEKVGIPESEFSRRPVEVLQRIRDLVGEVSFSLLEKGIIAQVKERFRIDMKNLNLEQVLVLAKQSYLRDSI